ncbi:hypothetical protein Glove_186g180 [Diversispora epigaea]|uniref:Uncharacterized protein n=1 Tax=Diversispora epigaea TaxID=1348612 RepID=A0A397IPV4_9GLOM|nr:hypothetical protein Glove_186g180 [Diversispora epigaea]
MNDISDSLKRQLEILSDHKSPRVAARNRATKLLENLQETLTKRREILNFIESQDLKFAENRYKINVELSVITDKTAVTGKTTEKFARSLNNDHNIRALKIKIPVEKYRLLLIMNKKKTNRKKVNRKKISGKKMKAEM